MTETDKRHDSVTVDGLARMLQDGRITRRGFLAGAAGLLGSIGAAEALLARVAGAQTTSKNTLVVGQSSDVSKLDPQMSTTVNDIAITFNLFDNLLTPPSGRQALSRPRHRVEAGDPTTWPFKLRPGVKWHNGDPFTSADAKFSLERTYDPTAKTIVTRSSPPSIASRRPIRSRSSSTPRSRTRCWPRARPSTAARSCPRSTWRRWGRTTFNAKPIGTGPVQLASWVKDDRVVLDANPDYWGGKIERRPVDLPADSRDWRRASRRSSRARWTSITQLPPDQRDRVAKAPTTRDRGASTRGLYVPVGDDAEAAARQPARSGRP